MDIGRIIREVEARPLEQPEATPTEPDLVPLPPEPDPRTAHPVHAHGTSGAARRV